MKVVPFLFLVFAIFGCTQIADEKSRGNPIVIDFEKAVELDSLISPRFLFSEVDFILLKTPDSVKITIASKIKEFGDRLIILDHRKKALFAFSHTGEFINMVGNKGEGPEEFREVTDFDVDEDFLYVYSRPDFAILKFDKNLKFQKKIKIKEWGWQLSILESGNIAIYSLILDGEDNYNINIYDPKGDLIQKRMDYDKNGDYEATDYSGFINGEFYTYPLSSLIYKINEKEKYDSVKFEINFPGRFPEDEVYNFTRYKENELKKSNSNILTKFVIGGNNEFLCYYHFRSGQSNGYTLGIQLSSGQKFGHLNLFHGATGKFEDIYLQMFFIGPYNMPSYSKSSESYLIASNIETIGIYQEYIVDLINKNKVYDPELLKILNETDLEETIVMRFKLKYSI